MSGDFRQVLPIIQGASESRIVQSCLKYSYLWEDGEVEVVRLRENERVKRKLRAGDTAAARKLEKWAKFLLKVGEDKATKDEAGEIKLPPKIVAKSNCLKDFVTEILPNLNSGMDTYSTVILTSLNKDMDDINNLCLKRFPGKEEQTFRSIDSVTDCADPTEFDIQYLNSRTPSGTKNEIF